MDCLKQEVPEKHEYLAAFSTNAYYFNGVSMEVIPDARLQFNAWKSVFGSLGAGYRRFK